MVCIVCGLPQAPEETHKKPMPVARVFKLLLVFCLSARATVVLLNLLRLTCREVVFRCVSPVKPAPVKPVLFSLAILSRALCRQVRLRVSPVKPVPVKPTLFSLKTPLL